MSKDETGQLTHLDDKGRARMVDVGTKKVTERTAVARASIRASTETMDRIYEGTVPKGDVLATARIAGIMAAKRTSELIPLCHPISLTTVKVDIERTAPDLLEVTSTVRCLDRTGVEMEALVGASVASLTVYDMCKALERGITVEHIGLVEKSGGRSGHWTRNG